MDEEKEVGPCSEVELYISRFDGPPCPVRTSLEIQGTSIPLRVGDVTTFAVSDLL